MMASGLIIGHDNVTNVDHVMPQVLCKAPHNLTPPPWNLLLTHRKCNTAKGNREPTLYELMCADLIGILMNEREAVSEQPWVAASAGAR